MNKTEALNFVNNANWVYAKSYSKTFPHFYTTRDRNDEKQFEEFLYYIRENSILKKFYSKEYLYLELDGYEYWEMGRPIKAVQVLNRAKINDDAKYRFPAPPKENEAILKEKLKIRDDYVDNLLSKKEKTEKDVLQLKFLLDNKRRIHGGGKNIIDNSKLKIRYE